MTVPLELRQIVSRQGWLSGEPEQFRKTVLDKSQLIGFKAGATLYTVGDPPGGVYGLIAGGLRVVLAPNNRAPFFMHFFVPGTWVGDTAAVTGQPRLVTLAAIKETRMLYLPLQAVNAILHEVPDAYRSFARLTQSHMATALGAIGDLMIRDPTQRFIAVLLRLCNCRNLTPPGLRTIELDFSQDELAGMANVTRIRVNSILKQLHEAGHLDAGYRHIQVLAPDRLRDMLDE